jgi:hypothetical protein
MKITIAKDMSKEKTIPHKNCIENSDGPEDDIDVSFSLRRRPTKILKKNKKMTNVQIP